MKLQGIFRAGLVALAMVHAPGSREQAVRFATGRTITAGPLGLTNSITVTASPATATISLTSKGLSAPSSTVNITTTWSLLSLASIHVYGFFTTPSQALLGQTNGKWIPAADVLASVPTGGGSATSYAAFTGTNTIVAGSASLLLITQSNLVGSLLGGTRTDAMNLEVNLTGTGTTYNADKYVGTLTLQAQTF
ncbi:hypothetical protein [Silvibacterium acidisoli]|uniref:hypothetical protein n=1 Tax=Acidobacteriaceae bacterium ZG23-2 TaxID=2883246 RepID=UPI00406C72C1